MWTTLFFVSNHNDKQEGALPTQQRKKRELVHEGQALFVGHKPYEREGLVGDWTNVLTSPVITVLIDNVE